MGGTTGIANACDLLDKLSRVSAGDIEKAAKAEEDRLIHTVEPDDGLVTPMEPDFVTGHLNVKAGGRPVAFEALYDAYVDGEIIYLAGPTGGGKTTIARALVDRANKARYEHNRKAFERNVALAKAKAPKDQFEPYKHLEYVLKTVQGHEEARTAEMVGDTGLVYDEKGNRQVVAMLGAALEAAVKGYTLLVDEADAIPAGVMAQCHGLFDKRVRSMSFWLNGRQDYTKHPRFRVIFTANTKGYGENAAEYAHVQTQSRAMLNRVSYIVDVGYMLPGSETALLKKRVPEVPDVAVQKMVECANRLRAAYMGGSLDLVVSTRDIESWAREVRRAIKRGAKGSSDSDLWNRVVVPAAGPTICSKAADEGTAAAVNKELSWR